MTTRMYFDDTPGRTLRTKVEKAAGRYEARIGGAPSCVFVNCDDAKGTDLSGFPFRVMAAKWCLANCVMVGDAAGQPKSIVIEEAQ